MHVIGFAPGCAPHASTSASDHVNDSPTDLMYRPDAKLAGRLELGERRSRLQPRRLLPGQHPRVSRSSNSPYLASLVRVAVTPANPTIARAHSAVHGDGYLFGCLDGRRHLVGDLGLGQFGGGDYQLRGARAGSQPSPDMIGASLAGLGGSTLLTVVKAPQSITFGALANRTFGDPDFTVSATASSGLAVDFAASGSCAVSAVTVHLTGAGSCTLTASQAGDSNYDPAAPASQTFSVAPRPQLKAPRTCTVAKVVGKRLAAAKLAIKRRHCRTGRVGYAHSRKRKGIVISQSRRPGKVVPANTKINLVVSRGSKH